ncbi:MAG: hypothetical protein Q7W56_14045 [Candidatus Latescibacteria bacterium]|nr:hypothetical protein [Candidatus Latescibacterota bacterium]
MSLKYNKIKVEGPLLALAVLLAGSTTAQADYSVLCLSAAPEAYVEELIVPYGQDFDLYVILAGPVVGEPLPWRLDTVDWAVLGSCCGGSPAFLIGSELGGAPLTHDGDPVIGVRTTSAGCVQQDVITLARLSFTWVYEPTGPFFLGAAALAPAFSCDDTAQFLGGRSLRIVPTGITPAVSSSWGEVKALFHD